uniref:EOG090X08WT n=1 Tax=Alona affinis TaxID=381656 RepID=A0A9N6WS44_9CRUS|nr:EOG090X08WT [Alona affinis]
MSLKKVVPILSTAGAIPVRNEKGEISMQKVKVNRYVSGKRPDYAATHSSSDESDAEEFIRPQKKRNRGRYEKSESEESVEGDVREESPELPASAYEDRRLRRLRNREADEDGGGRLERHRHIHEPEVVDTEQQPDSDEEAMQERMQQASSSRRWEESSEEEEEAEELNEDDIEYRRMVARQKAVIKQQEEELLAREEEKESEGEEDEEASEYEEYTDSEDEDTGPRLKPVFVSKRDRVTIAEKEKEELKQKQLEQEAKRQAEERRRQTLKMVEEQVRKEMQIKDEKDLESGILSVLTDAEDEEMEYESWKLRELKRNKRNREEREAEEREKMEVERLRNMTEEERRLELKNNPKQITNKASKGKYKFLQKYYHRGAFYLDEEDDVYKRDFAVPTLEDHFDKTVLPKVMQVKNFGRSGRTKYTHLVDQDTSQADAPWASHSAQNLKFHTQHAGGVKQNFERPALRKSKHSGS